MLACVVHAGTRLRKRVKCLQATCCMQCASNLVAAARRPGGAWFPSHPPPTPPRPGAPACVQVRFARTRHFVPASDGPEDNRQLFFSRAPPRASEAELHSLFSRCAASLQVHARCMQGGAAEGPLCDCVFSRHVHGRHGILACGFDHTLLARPFATGTAMWRA